MGVLKKKIVFKIQKWKNIKKKGGGISVNK